MAYLRKKDFGYKIRNPAPIIPTALKNINSEQLNVLGIGQEARNNYEDFHLRKYDEEGNKKFERYSIDDKLLLLDIYDKDNKIINWFNILYYRNNQKNNISLFYQIGLSCDIFGKKIWETKLSISNINLIVNNEVVSIKKLIVK
jgi:hypothetical protein